jgi:ABC-type nickel/cobalt efflux system permease component RcnA
MVGGLASLLVAVPASAHPLGNFTTNLHLGVIVNRTGFDLTLIVDMAEIPTFRVLPEIDASGDGSVSDEEAASFAIDTCATHQSAIALTSGNNQLPLEAMAGAAVLLPGEGGLQTLRLECVYRAETGGIKPGAFQIDNLVYSDRIGWRELVVAGDGMNVRSELPAVSPSSLLTNFPGGAPVNVSSGAMDVIGLNSPAGSRAGQSPEAGSTPMGSDLLSSGPAALALLGALGLGVGHALAPGHGKTMVAAYLVGRGGNWRHALGLGLAVAISHTVGVGILGLITAVASDRFQPDRVYPWLSGVSALTVTAIGIVMLGRTVKRNGRSHHHHDDHEHGGHSHTHDHHQPFPSLGWRSLAALGLAGGLVPSASAVILLLGAVGGGRPWFGVALVAAFGVGMSLALVGAGLLALGGIKWGWRLVDSGRLRHRLEHLVPPVAAAAVIVVGITLLWQAVRIVA